MSCTSPSARRSGLPRCRRPSSFTAWRCAAQAQPPAAVQSQVGRDVRDRRRAAAHQIACRTPRWAARGQTASDFGDVLDGPEVPCQTDAVTAWADATGERSTAVAPTCSARLQGLFRPWASRALRPRRCRRRSRHSRGPGRLEQVNPSSATCSLPLRAKRRACKVRRVLSDAALDQKLPRHQGGSGGHRAEGPRMAIIMRATKAQDTARTSGSLEPAQGLVRLRSAIAAGQALVTMRIWRQRKEALQPNRFLRRLREAFVRWAAAALAATGTERALEVGGLATRLVAWGLGKSAWELFAGRPRLVPLSRH